MAATRLVLRSPGDPNLEELVSSTFAAFELLRPWCGVRDGLVVKHSIQRQALSYVKAIDLSISAAQDGFNITEDVLIFADLAHSLDEQGRQLYLREMVKHAEKGRCNAVAAQAQFRDVRSTMEKLIKEARTDIEGGHRDVCFSVTSKTNIDLDNLKRDIDILERFLDHISVYIAWWNVLEMEHATQKDRGDSLIVDYQSLREVFVIKKWRTLKQKYVEYTVKIQGYQDANPEFFAYREAGRVLLDPVVLAECPVVATDDNSTSEPSVPVPKARNKKKRGIIEGFVPMYRLTRGIFG